MFDDKQKLLRKVQAAGFAVTEANLYLDTHPDCQEGLKYFREKREEYKKLIEEYQSKYPSFTAIDSSADDCFEWAVTPFPWERSEN